MSLNLGLGLGLSKNSIRAIQLFVSKTSDATTWPVVGTPDVTLTGDTSPAAGISSYSLTDNNAAAYEAVIPGVASTIAVPADTETYYVRFYLKENASATSIFGINFILSGGTTVAANSRIDARDGSVVSGSATVTDVGGGWYFVETSLQNNSTNTNLQVTLYPAARNLTGGDTPTATGSCVISAFELYRVL